MRYALQSILKMRTMREDRASAELSAARQEVKTAARKLEDRKAELRQYEETKEERRDKIYEAVLGHAITQEELEMVLEGVARIDEEGVLKADNVAMATGELNEKKKVAETARQSFVTASKNRMKITEHKAMWIAEEAREQEHRQEVELEDFTGRKNVDDANDNGN